jgi:hypothetical protein
MTTILPLQPIIKQSISGQHTQTNWQWFLRLDSSREATTRQNQARQQRSLNAVRLAVTDTVAAVIVQRAYRHAGSDGGDGTGAATRVSGEEGRDGGDAHM